MDKNMITMPFTIKTQTFKWIKLILLILLNNTVANMYGGN